MLLVMIFVMLADERKASSASCALSACAAAG